MVEKDSASTVVIEGVEPKPEQTVEEILKRGGILEMIACVRALNMAMGNLRSDSKIRPLTLQTRAENLRRLVDDLKGTGLLEEPDTEKRPTE